MPIELLDPLRCERCETASTTEVAALIGATFRQVDHWRRLGLLGLPAVIGSGRRPRWTADAVDRARLICALRRAGVDGNTSGDPTRRTLDAWDAHAQPRTGYLVVREDRARHVYSALGLAGALTAAGVVIPLGDLLAHDHARAPAAVAAH